MAQFFLHQWRYKSEQIKKMLIEKADRAEIVRTSVEAFGGRLHSFFYCFGEYDGLSISEFPDNARAMACAMAILAEGRVKFVHTTTLLSPTEGLKAMKEAGDAISGR